MKKILILSAACVMLFNTGCEKYIEGNDVSPNQASQTTPPLLLSNAELAVMVHYTGQLARIPSILTQQSAGTDFQFVGIAEYSLQEGDNINEWNNIYGAGIASDQELIKLAGNTNPHYRGIAKVLKAMELGLTTDIWGDIPNSEAMLGSQGEEFYNPHFDPQQDVIKNIQDLLSEAITDFSATVNVIVPGPDDFIHGGDIAKWTATAWMLKARYANRLSKKDPIQSANDALSFIASSGVSSNADDVMAPWGPDGNELNPWYAFQINRTNYMKMGKFFIELLKTTGDPRLPFYATTDDDGNYTGTAVDSFNTNTSNIGDYYASDISALPLITYEEMKFIEAEANFRLGNMQPAADAHNAAVIASVEKVTGAVIDPAFLAAQASETGATITLDKIMTQKYVAMFTQPEVWSDWRRTNLPTLTPNPSAVVNAIPRRLPTPFDERIYNSNATVVSNVLTPVWWDQ